MRDQGFNIVITQGISKGFHLRNIPVFDAFLNGLGSSVILQVSLDLGIGKVFDTQLGPHFRFADPVFPVAFGAILGEELLAIRSTERQGG